MTTSKSGISLIKFFEACKLKAYRDSGGVWTIGWGSTLDVKEGMVITQEEADNKLLKDLSDAERRVDKNLFILKVDITQNEFDTLVSQAFNLKSFEQLISYLPDRKKYKEKMLLYCRDIKGNFLKGLKIRRIAERLHFENRKWYEIAKSLQQKNITEILEIERQLFYSITDNDIPDAKGLDTIE